MSADWQLSKPTPLTVESIRADLARTCDAGEMRMVDALIATMVLRGAAADTRGGEPRTEPSEEAYAAFVTVLEKIRRNHGVSIFLPMYALEAASKAMYAVDFGGSASGSGETAHG